MISAVRIEKFEHLNGTIYNNINLTYQAWGPTEGPVVLVCHALTGNSLVAGDNGWWKNIVGDDKIIDTLHYRVICFDIPGNGYDGGELISDYYNWSIGDVARLFVQALDLLNIHRLYALIGGSLGGMICWEIAVRFPYLANFFISAAAHFKATDWLIAHNQVQMQILDECFDGLAVARMMAMLFYRSPQNFDHKFKGERKDKDTFQVESYLRYQGEKINERFDIKAYKLMTHLLTHHDVAKDYNDIESALSRIKAKTILIGIDSDLLLPAYLIEEAAEKLNRLNIPVRSELIKSTCGHDAFLIESEQLKIILEGVF